MVSHHLATAVIAVFKWKRIGPRDFGRFNTPASS